MERGTESMQLPGKAPLRVVDEPGETAARYEAILASTLDPIITIDARGTIVTASESVTRVFQWRSDELVGRNVSILMDEPHRSGHDGYLDAYRRTGRTGILGRPREFDALRKDGTVVPIALSVSRVDIPGRAEPLFTGIIRDVSDRRRAERELRLLQQLAFAMGERSDLDHALGAMLERICAVTGWPYGEAWTPEPDGLALRDGPVFHAGSAGRGGDAARRVVQTIRSGEGLIGHVWKTQRPAWLSAIGDDDLVSRARAASGLEIADGVALAILLGSRVVAVVSFLLDARSEEDDYRVELVKAAIAPLGMLIQRRQAEAALRESERRLRETLERAELIAVMLDEHGRVTFSNDHLLALTGWSRDEVAGKDWFDLFIPARERTGIRRLHRAAIESERLPAHYENPIVTRTGEERLVAWVNTLLRDVDGRVIGTNSLGLDVTDRRRNEEELSRYQERLEEIVTERTEALERSHEQLRSADRLATIGTLTAGLGHDMNNVLFPLRCRLDALDAAALSHDAREHFVAVRRSVEYLQQLTDGLHLLALDPDEPTALTESTNVRTWWEQAGPLLARSLSRTIELTTTWPDALPPIALAPHRLTQAMLNLIVNAGEAIGSEAGHIAIRARPSADGTWVSVTVEDDGPGMGDAVRRNALTPFFTTKKRRLGTGLGLSLVDGVVRAAGGRVEIDSAPGRGTRVKLILPAASAPMGVRTDDGAPPPTAFVSVADPRIASFLAVILGTAGYDVRRGTPAGPEESSDAARGALWITEPTPAAFDMLRTREPSGTRVIVLGEVGPEWKNLDARIVTDPADFEAVREAISSIATSGARS